MIEIKADANTREKLCRLVQPAKICDKQGRVLGEFRPVADSAMYAGVESPLSEQELRRREYESETYTTVKVSQPLKEL